MDKKTIVFSFIKTVLSTSPILKEGSQNRDVLFSSGSLNTVNYKVDVCKREKEKKREPRTSPYARQALRS
jgi:hypothetical protein